jgi:hypothetical protein
LRRTRAGSRLDGGIHPLCVIRAVRHHRGELSRDFGQQPRDLGTIARPSRGDLRCDNIACVRVDDHMELPPLAPVVFGRGFWAAMNLETRAIDEDVDRTAPATPTQWHGCQRPRASRQRRVIGDTNGQAQQCGYGSQKTFRLSQPQMVDGSNGERRFDGQVRIHSSPPGVPLPGARQA